MLRPVVPLLGGVAAVLWSRVGVVLVSSQVVGLHQSQHRTSPDPSNNTELTATEGDHVTFRCNIATAGGQQIVWRRGTEVLSAGPSLLKHDPRYSVAGPRSRGRQLGAELSVAQVTIEDAGEFVCQVQTDLGPRETRHVLTIQVPPRIRPVPASGQVTARQGESVSLRCNATGVPPPSIAWHKSVGSAQGGHQGCGGSCFTIPSVSLATSGDYLCSAVNGVGHPQHATITLNVLYPPEVSCGGEAAQGGGGAMVSLGCRVHGEPSPSVNWFRDGHMLESDGKRFRTEWNLDKRMHSLVIVRSAEEDFGNYSCVASNLMGTSRCFMELNGRPFNLSFYPSTDQMHSPHYYQVRWTTTSHYTVDRFTLLYRQISGGSHRGSAPSSVPAAEWSTVKIPGPGHHATPVLQSSWVLTNLSAEADYECIVQAHNRHGWSSPSPIYVFQTGEEGGSGVRSRHNWDRSLLVSAGSRLGAVLGLATYSATLLAVFVGRWIDGNLL